MRRLPIGLLLVVCLCFNCEKKNPTAPEQPATIGTITDIDGNVYRTVKIGNQCWMAENLKVTRYRNGDAIPNITGSIDWFLLVTVAYCNYNNNEDNATIYGRLYNWFAVDDSRNIAPAGWHVPSDEEWKQLEMYLGMSQSNANTEGNRGVDEGGKLKESGTTHWRSPNTGATNESGFTALPGGNRSYGGSYANMSNYTAYWSSSEYEEHDSGFAWCRGLYYGLSVVARIRAQENFGFSVRCIKDY